MLAERIAAVPGADIREFDYGDHLLIWSWRRLATSGEDHSTLAREFAEACGEDAGEVFLTFCTFLKALDFASRRSLVIGPPGSVSLTSDEQQVLTLIAAAQSKAPSLFEAHLRWLASPARRHILRIAVGALTTALAVNGIDLRSPVLDAPRACQRPLAAA